MGAINEKHGGLDIEFLAEFAEKNLDERDEVIENNQTYTKCFAFGLAAYNQ